MKASLQDLILDYFSRPECRYIVDVENGFIYSRNARGEVSPLKSRNGEVFIYIKKEGKYTKAFQLKVHQIVFLMKYGKYSPDSDIIHIDGILSNNRCSNLKEVPVKVVYDPKKAHRNDIVDTVVKMYTSGITAKEIAERLLIPYQRVTRAISVHKAEKEHRQFRRKANKDYLMLHSFKNAYI